MQIPSVLFATMWSNNSYAGPAVPMGMFLGRSNLYAAYFMMILHISPYFRVGSGASAPVPPIRVRSDEDGLPGQLQSGRARMGVADMSNTSQQQQTIPFDAAEMNKIPTWQVDLETNAKEQIPPWSWAFWAPTQQGTQDVVEFPQLIRIPRSL